MNHYAITIPWFSSKKIQPNNNNNKKNLAHPVFLLHVFTFNWPINCFLISLQDRIEKSQSRWVCLANFGSVLKTHLGSAGLFWARCFLSDFPSRRNTHSQTPSPCQTHPHGQFNLPANIWSRKPVSMVSPWKASTKTRRGKELLGNSCCVPPAFSFITYKWDVHVSLSEKRKSMLAPCPSFWAEYCSLESSIIH